MASVCKSQQCSVERRGFRQELDSWRYKLIHCVGFESILEGLFGPSLLEDLSIFKDCEPTGVCDWSFDENCLFCCLRREKVKEHLAGFNKSVSETGHENLLKHEQSKIIRLERQAEEFINAVFYKKDSPRISDPNIPLVAREIMQRMIRQFAAEYTSKNSSSQDSSPPNSTKDQSLLKPTSGQSSPPHATTQNPVLSKLLMADQDSPLDLTVKKPQTEEPCEQADGVLDLSTKKSPCSISTHSCISPSTSNAIGNGIHEAEKIAIDPSNSSSLTLENFMVKLCAHHKNQFIQVLNNLCTEEQFKTSKSCSALDSKSLNTEDNSNSFNNSKFAVEDCILPAGKQASPAFEKVKNCPSGAAQNLENVTLPVPLEVKENSVTGMVLNNYIHTSPQEEHNAKKHVFHNKPTETNSKLLETGETGCTNKMELQQTDLSECCVLSHSNSMSIPVTVAQESEFLINLPTCADKENAQCTSPRLAILEKDTDYKLKQNTAHSVVMKHGSPLNHCESFLSLADSPVSHLHKIRGHENLKHSKSVKRCQNSSGLRIAEYGDHCDVVHLSETITAQSHFQHQKSFVCSRNTARKSTRGYLFTGGCCQLSTVRTLVRSAKVEDKGNCALNISETLIIPNGLTEAPTSTDIFQLEKSTANSAENKADIDNKYKNNVHTISDMAGQSVNSVSDSLLAVFSLVHNESEKTPLSQIHPANEIFTKQIVEINNKDQGDISLVSSTISENILENHISDIAHSDAYERQAISPKAETLNPEHGYGAKVSPNDILSGKNINQFSKISTVSSIDNCLIAPLLNKIDNSVNATLNSSPQNMSLEDCSIAMLTDFEPTYTGSGPNTPPECPIKENLKHMEGNITQIVEQYEQAPVYIKNEILEENTDMCSVYLEPIIKTELNLEPLKIKDWFKTPNNIDKTSAEQVHCLIDSCAKMAEIRDLQLQQSSVTKQNVERYQTANSQFKSEGTLQTKDINENGNAKVAKLETMENDLLSNNSNCEISVPFKKVKKTTIPSDRRLRSLQKNVSLHVLISQFSSLCSAQRFVEFSTEHAPQNETLTVFDSTIEESSDSEDCFKHILGNQYKEEKPMLSEMMIRKKNYCTQNISENLKISLNLSSNKRNVYFCSDEMGCLKVNESCLFPLVINSACKYKHDKSSKQVLAFASDSLTEAKSKTMCVSVKPVTQPTKMKFLKSKLRCKTAIECSDQQICSHNTEFNGKDENRPKFIDWCFEEEGQERISNFNGKYTSVHSNWIQLDKEMAAGPKSKNKSDKLKEIWRSKKRIRKSKFADETKNHSPMQMLFMNGFKFSDICKWFLETTETKSLVIVKQLNTRSPEEHQLPVAPLQRHPSPSIYTHKLQAERLKKHLRKFASVSPTRTQSTLNKLDDEAKLGDSIKGASDSKYIGSKVCVNKPTSVQILKKYSNFRQKMHNPSLPLEKKQMEQITETKMNYRQRIKEIHASNKNLQNVSISPTCKPGIIAGSQKAKKRPKGEQLIKPMVQESKKRKIDAHQLNKNRCSMVALPTKKSVKTLGKKDTVAKCQPSERHKSKPQTQKATMLKKRKTTLQKHSSKKLVVLKRLTRSSKRRTSQAALKEFNRKLCTGSKKCNKNPFKQGLRKSQPDSPMQNKR